MRLQIERLGKVAITIEQDYWDIHKEYDKLTIVQVKDEFATYISRKPVPQGKVLTDRKYWIPFSSLQEDIVIDYNKFLNDYKTILDEHTETLKNHNDRIVSIENIKQYAENLINTSAENINKATETINKAVELVATAERLINTVDNLIPRIEEVERRLDNITNITEAELNSVLI